MASVVDEVVCAGDAVLQFRFSNEVLEMLRKHHVPCVMGNHDHILLSQDGVRARANGLVRPENLRFMQDWPTSLRLTPGGKKIYIAHGSPWNHLNEYILPQSKNTRRLGEIGADVMILGHTHYSMVLRVGRTLVINPGSICASSRDMNYERHWTYAILDLDTEEVEIRSKVDPRLQHMSAGDRGIIYQPEHVEPIITLIQPADEPQPDAWEKVFVDTDDLFR